MFTNKNKIKIMAIFFSSIISIILMILLSSLVNLTLKKISQQERIYVLEQLVSYKSKIEKEINSRINLVNGYSAFIKTYPNAGKKESLEYLSNLIAPDDKFIRNISVLKDTTIIWVYPEKGNETAIGKDISKIPQQQESVLLAKNKGITIFQGPVKLIQGGIGFVSRIPTYDKNNKYWGQISVVINGEELIKKLWEFDDNSPLRVSLYNKKDYPLKPFLGEAIEIKENPLVFETSINNAEWIIVAIPSKGWENEKSQYLVWEIFSIVLPLLIGLLFYNYIHSLYKIKNQLNYDTLTGVQSRAFLDSYEQIIFSRANRTNTKIGIIVVDLNNFKSINDKHGHLAGDMALKLVADSLLSSCRSTDNVIRTGGDEFLMIFTDIKVDEDFNMIVEKVKEKNILSLNFKAKTIEFSYSVGAAIYPNSGNSLDEVVNSADKEMYNNKRKIKNL